MQSRRYITSKVAAIIAATTIFSLAIIMKSQDIAILTLFATLLISVIAQHIEKNGNNKQN